MQLKDFRVLVERLWEDVPERYLEGVVGVEVSPRTVPHPVQRGVYTLGECIPVDTGGEPVTSRVVLYHGSFQALAAQGQGLDWRQEAWDTLLHELRHHVEWRAHAADLETFDWAAEQNFRRRDGQSFDSLFHLAGERLEAGVFQIDDDVFWDFPVRRVPGEVDISWRGRRYRVDLPRRSLPLFIALDGLEPAPPGDAVVVIRRPPRLLDLIRPAPTPVLLHARARSLS
ncbi:MAG TPA: metallopeptidase family protein [Gemmatimonadales bacterium]|nr:metallopeptidase family protein [Gemmatimonadales bacterium]